MKHESIERLLPDFAHGRLDDSDAESLREHLTTCGACRTRLAAMQPLMQDLDAWRPKVPEGYFQTVLPAFRARLESREPRAGKVGSSWMRLLAPLGAAVVVAGLLASLPPGPPKEGQNGLRDLAGEFDAGEFAESILEELETSLVGQQQQEMIAQTVPENAATRQLLEHIAGENGLEELAPLRAVDDLENEELDAVLRRLEQRTFL